MEITAMDRELGRDRFYKTWHASDLHMLIWFQSDGGSLVLSDGVYEICRGYLCFVATGTYHYTMPEEPENYLRSKIFFPADFFDKTAAYLENGACLQLFREKSAVCARIPRELWAETDSLFSEAAEGELTAAAALLKLLCWADRYADTRIPAADGFAAVAVDYINRHIQESITVDDLCAAVHVSKYYFCRRFKEMTGLTPMDYVLQTRLALAKNMLRRSDCAVGQISESCGFGSESYFCRAFRRATGLTPLQYRKKGSR